MKRNAKICFVVGYIISPCVLNSCADLFPLICLAQEPFNAEPPRSVLNSSYVTPVDFFYKRNHGPIPLVDDIARCPSSPFFINVLSFHFHFNYYKPFRLHCRYSVSINGLMENPKELFMKDIR